MTSPLAPLPAPRIYLDHNATSPLRPAARDAALWALEHLRGNPSSAHAEGRAARAALETARAQVATLCARPPAQVVFTSGGTEANNLALTDLTRRALRAKRRHVLALPLEHPSVRAPLTQLAALGAITLEWLPLNPHGLLDVAEVRRRARPAETGLICCMAAHNSLGTCYPISQVAEVARAIGALLHCDATQAAGRLPLSDLAAADTLALSAHKLGGPAGVGALICRAPLTSPLLLGGGQEGGARSGTENLSGIVAFGAAAQEAAQHLTARATHLQALRQQLWEGIAQAWPAAQRNTPPRDADCLPNTLHVSFLGVDGLLLTRLLDRAGVAVSAGSACQDPNTHDASLRAAHLTPKAIAGAVRISLGPDTTPQEVARTLTALHHALQLAHSASP